jgi:hypothetical protein
MAELTRIEMRFSDGTVRWLQGDDARRWEKWVNGQLAWQQLRAGTVEGPGVEWLERRLTEEELMIRPSSEKG